MNEPAIEATKPCPVCGETIKAAALKCRFCGEDLAAFRQKQDESEERTLYSGRLPVFPSVGTYLLAAITLGIAALVFWMKSLALSFDITTQRIRVHRGVLSKTTQNLELYRVDDISIAEPFGMRMLGNGIVRLRTSDRDQPELVIHGIPKAMELGEKIRRSVQVEREKRGLRVWENA